MAPCARGCRGHNSNFADPEVGSSRDNGPAGGGRPHPGGARSGPGWTVHSPTISHRGCRAAGRNLPRNPLCFCVRSKSASKWESRRALSRQPLPAARGEAHDRGAFERVRDCPSVRARRGGGRRPLDFHEHSALDVRAAPGPCVGGPAPVSRHAASGAVRRRGDADRHGPRGTAAMRDRKRLGPPPVRRASRKRRRYMRAAASCATRILADVPCGGLAQASGQQIGPGSGHQAAPSARSRQAASGRWPALWTHSPRQTPDMMPAGGRWRPGARPPAPGVRTI